MKPLVDAIQLTAGVIIAAGQVMQLKQTYLTRDVEGIARGNVLSIALACWMFELYAVWYMEHVYVFLITNTVSTILSTLMAILYFEFEKQENKDDCI